MTVFHALAVVAALIPVVIVAGYLLDR